VHIDDFYLHKIKTIYSKIIEFATLAQALDLRAEDINAIHNIKKANQYFVEVVKDLKDLQPNMTQYLVSTNDLMKGEYNGFRKRISKVVRIVINVQSLQKMPEGNSDEQTEKKLTDLKEVLADAELKLKDEDIKFNSNLEKLIREKRITSKMASSLMNDNAIVKAITKNLIRATKLLYVKSDYLYSNVDFEEESGSELPSAF
jgi:phosphate:Na+ symporter